MRPRPPSWKTLFTSQFKCRVPVVGPPMIGVSGGAARTGFRSRPGPWRRDTPHEQPAEDVDRRGGHRDHRPFVHAPARSQAPTANRLLRIIRRFPRNYHIVRMRFA